MIRSRDAFYAANPDLDGLLAFPPLADEAPREADARFPATPATDAEYAAADELFRNAA